jgi:hypothetical protein
MRMRMRRGWPLMAQRRQKWRCARLLPLICISLPLGEGVSRGWPHWPLDMQVAHLPTVRACTALHCAVEPHLYCRTTTTRRPRSLWERRMTMRLT